MSLSLLLIIVLVILLVGGLPNFGLTSNYAPSSVLGLVVIVLLILVLTGRIN